MPFNVGAIKPSTSVTFTGASISFSDTGDNTVVAATAGQSIRVYRIFFVASADTTVTIKNGTTALTGEITVFAGGAFVLEYNEEPWFTTSAGSAFVLSQTGTAQISGRLEYQKP